MPELGTPGSARGAGRKTRPYRDFRNGPQRQRMVHAGPLLRQHLKAVARRASWPAGCQLRIFSGV
ncbi:MAG: hypothetical protein ACAI18_09145, partial [Gemmatimonadales bacterium]